MSIQYRHSGEEEREDWETAPGDLSTGHYVRGTLYDGLTDDQADELEAELKEREKRRMPFGFRAPESTKNRITRKRRVAK